MVSVLSITTLRCGWIEFKFNAYIYHYFNLYLLGFGDVPCNGYVIKAPRVGFHIFNFFSKTNIRWCFLFCHNMCWFAQILSWIKFYKEIAVIHFINFINYQSNKIILCLVCIYYQIIRGGMSVPWGDGCSRGMGVPGGECSRGMGVPGGWVFQGDECSRETSVLGDGCLGGWEFLLPSQITATRIWQILIIIYANAW